MGRHTFLFLLTNLAVVLTLSVVLSVFGVGRYVGPGGLDMRALAVFCLVWGMGGAFISLQLSRWMAKRATGLRLVDGRTGQAELVDPRHEALATAKINGSGRWMVFFSTHPPLEARIAALERSA